MTKRILVACEESQIVTIAFRNLGYEAYSCDILPESGGHPEWRIQDNVLNHLDKGWDLMIAHPPCTYLSTAGNAWNYHPNDKHLPKEQRRPHPKFPNRLQQRNEAIIFFLRLIDVDIPRICVENPKGIMSKIYRKPDQYIQPYWFGDAHIKTTGLWLKNLPLLKPTIILPRPQPIYTDKKGKKRYFTDSISDSKIRSKTFLGIAKAFAEQWGPLL